MSDWTIRQLVLASDNWFCLQPEYLGDGNYRYVMERVTSWALIEAEGVIDHIAALCARSYPITDDINEDTTFVYGRDKSPSGTTWEEVFGSVTPTGLGWIELPNEVVTAIHGSD